jgi:hypothetical protein
MLLHRDEMPEDATKKFFVLAPSIGSKPSTGLRRRSGNIYAPGAGFGFPFLLNKRSRTNLCTDYGWGKGGSLGFYLSIQKAF